MKLKIIFLTVLLTVASISFSQIKSIGDFFGSGQENAEILFKSYIAPWTNALGASLNGGWYNSAKPHKLLGVDLTFSSSFAIIPKADRSFDLSTIGLPSEITFPNGSSTPTVAGSRDGSVPIVYTPLANYPNQNVRFNSPNGTGLNFMAAPMAQIGLGLIKETEVDFRYLPNISLGKYGTMGLWGIGVKHSIKQWIPVIAKLPVLQLSVQGGYTKFNTALDISVTPGDLGLSGTGNYDNQQIGLTVKSFTANLLVGANLPVVCFYGGMGFATTNANLLLSGYYPIPEAQGTTIVAKQSDKDPINVKITNSDGSKTKPRFNAGMRIKLGVLTIHADYTYANYSVASAGVGLSFR